MKMKFQHFAFLALSKIPATEMLFYNGPQTGAAKQICVSKM